MISRGIIYMASIVENLGLTTEEVREAFGL